MCTGLRAAPVHGERSLRSRRLFLRLSLQQQRFFIFSHIRRSSARLPQIFCGSPQHVNVCFVSTLCITSVLLYFSCCLGCSPIWMWGNCIQGFPVGSVRCQSLCQQATASESSGAHHWGGMSHPASGATRPPKGDSN